MARYEYCKIIEIGINSNNEKIYGVIDVRWPNIGIPYTWGDKKTAERAYAEQIMYVRYSEYKAMKKTGYMSAYRAKEAR